MRSAIVAALALALTIPLRAAAPGTIFNDDSCDIGLFPAATLLLPYFEVDAVQGGETTIFTVTNVTNLPQAVRVTLWTDYGFPVLSFNLYLTGYDVQSINLHDVIWRGRVAPDFGTGTATSPVGQFSGTSPTVAFDNPRLNEESCAEGSPVQLPAPYVERMSRAFTTGKLPAASPLPGCDAVVGQVHANAIGYATLDVVGRCRALLPTDEEYFAADIRYDNVLAGDYIQVSGNGGNAQASPMVHIRAIPDGGLPPDAEAPFEQTFYSRLQRAGGASDRRQPLPSTFAARWILGPDSETETLLKIWRDVATPAGAACTAYRTNADMYVREVVRFDEEENPTAAYPAFDVFGERLPRMPATSLNHVADTFAFPPNVDGALGGWMYLNLHDDRRATATQNWVVVTMRAGDRLSVDLDAISLGNGCSPLTPGSQALTSNGPAIGPAPNRW